MSRRTEQMASTIRRALQETIDRGFQDPRISGMITVTGLRITEDLKQALIDVSVMPAERQDLTMHGLRSAARHIRREVGDRVAIRQMPELVFRLDSSLKKQAAVLDAIAKAAAERQARENAGAPAPETEEARSDHPQTGTTDTRPDANTSA
jgi:ribosome-binding factor A